MPHKSIMLEFVCKQCGKVFLERESRLRDKKVINFCSWTCRYPFPGVKAASVDYPEERRKRLISISDKIDNFVSRTSKSATGCILWTGTLSGTGYGIFLEKAAHRFSYTNFVGDIPEGLFVLHRCDVRACVNPTHLFVGTQLDNLKDMVSKGRNIKGSRSNFAKLDEEQVLKIREIGATGMHRKEIAKMFGIDLSTVYCILSRRRWKTI